MQPDASHCLFLSILKQAQMGYTAPHDVSFELFVHQAATQGPGPWEISPFILRLTALCVSTQR